MLLLWDSQLLLVVKNLPANAGDKRRGFNPWIGKIAWRRAQQPTSVFLPGGSMDRGAWQAIGHSISKNQT